MAKSNTDYDYNEKEVFAITSKTALLNENNRTKEPIFEETVISYSAYYNKNKTRVFIDQVGKKKGALSRRVKSFKITSKQRISDVIKKIQSGEYVLPVKNVDKRIMYETSIKNGHIIKKKKGTVDVVQTNYNAKINYTVKGINIKAKPQLVCLIKVTDNDTGYSGYFVGYSNKMRTSRPSLSDINKAEEECKVMALAKFFNKYGSKKFDENNLNSSALYKESSTYFELEIIEKRFQYWKTKNLSTLFD